MHQFLSNEEVKSTDNSVYQWTFNVMVSAAEPRENWAEKKKNNNQIFIFCQEIGVKISYVYLQYFSSSIFQKQQYTVWMQIILSRMHMASMFFHHREEGRS